MRSTRKIIIVAALAGAILCVMNEERGIARPDSPTPISSPGDSAEVASPLLTPSGTPPPAASPLPTPSGTPPPATSPTPVSILMQQEVTGGFIRYIPDKEGNMEWKMEGTTGRFISPQCMELSNMKATSLSSKIGPLTIAVGKVLYCTNTKIARGDEDRITVRRESIILTGRGFIWSPHQEQIRVYEDVKVLIKEQGNLGFFPR
ncbi:MAG: hypothetical protein U9N73_04380 [Candidatus Auribacterota bacterium]|nr:hypothetical protein [Candidatus Auribacterota bacterium]